MARVTSQETTACANIVWNAHEQCPRHFNSSSKTGMTQIANLKPLNDAEFQSLHDLLDSCACLQRLLAFSS